MRHDLIEIAVVALHEFALNIATSRTEIARDRDLVLALVAFVELLDDLLRASRRNQFQRLFVHRARHLGLIAQDRIGRFSRRFAIDPFEGVHRAFVRARVQLNPLFQQPGDRRFRRPDRTVKEQDAFFGAVSLRRGFEKMYELHDRHIEAENGIFSVIDRIIEKRVVIQTFFVVDISRAAVTHDHVVHALKRIACDARLFFYDVEIIEERAFPIKISVFFFNSGIV